eukprot:TRINITY_DN8424_c0_g1_i1.p1 TRINITY_DN8424_c0_g1~~TRINITY_DN8424_c0_g1_i1.p1  ORF type:complete len:136 (-),score=48.31 TRINITY_DN8424_c0_g1_i1:126-497(-)
MAKVKTSELRAKNKADLLKQLDELKKELSQLRVAQVTGGAPARLARIRVVRKDIARVLTVVNTTQKEQLRLFYANKKHIPLDLRPKRTRAIRRRLAPSEANKLTRRATIQRTFNPQRRFALRV